MLALSILFVALLVTDALGVSPETRALIDWGMWAIWGAFAVELAVKTYLAPNRLRYLRTHWLDVLVVLVPALRPLRVARALNLLRAATLLPATARAIVALRSVLTSHGLHYALAVGGIALTASAAVVTWFERGSGGPIDRFSTALWWAITTATTVGYGDTYPVTTAGKIIAVLVMLVGIALFGLITANVSAYLVRSQQRGQVTVADLYRKLCEIEERLARLESTVAGDEHKSGVDGVSTEASTVQNGRVRQRE